MTYINGRCAGQIETIDAFQTRKEARAMIAEYRLAFRDQGWSLWLSSRSTREWRTK